MMMRLATLLLIALLAPTPPASAQSSDSATRKPLTFAARFNPLPTLAEPTKKATVPMLRPAATIVGEIVRIGDLIENAGAVAGVAIFRAPDLGQTGSVSAARVIEAVAPHAALAVDTRGLTEVVVTRASRAITSVEFEARIRGALAARQRLPDASNLTVMFDRDLGTVHVEPEAGAEPQITRLSFDPRSGRFDIVFELPGAARRLLRFTGSFAETFEAAVIARPIQSGAVLKEADFKFMRRPKAEHAPNVVTDAAQAIGLAARRTLRPGELLRQTDLAKPEIIARNDSVTITYEVPGIMVNLRGKALEAGAKGDIINVLNINSKKTIQATVVGPGHVSVAAAVLAVVTPSPSSATPTVSRPVVHPHAHARVR
jgi:flagella basal body P-ring formation protein FlgA